MQTINDDIKVLGNLSARKIDGRLSDGIKQELADEREADIAPLRAALETKANLDALDTKASVDELNEVKQLYNKAIEVINNLSDRLTALESNYDPTVIE